MAALSSLSRISGVRPVIIVLGDAHEAERREENGAIVIDGLVQRYLNNAVASLRLSSLPTLVWWRAGDPQKLQDLAALVDRVVMDLDEPSGYGRSCPPSALRNVLEAIAARSESGPCVTRVWSPYLRADGSAGAAALGLAGLTVPGPCLASIPIKKEGAMATCRDVMTREPACCEPGDSITRAAEMM